jgi:hypothetical protein
MNIFRDELHRRAREGTLEQTQAREMRALRGWYLADNPNDRRMPQIKTLRRKLGREYNELTGVPN